MVRLYLNEVTDFALTRELRKLFQAETRRLKKSFSNELVWHIGTLTHIVIYVMSMLYIVIIIIMQLLTHV